MDVQLNLVDLNTAEPVELRNVPGVGSRLAERIIASRPFSNLTDLRRVSGVGPALFEQIKPYVMVSSTPGQNLQPGPAVSGAGIEVPQVAIPSRTRRQIGQAPMPTFPETQVITEPKIADNEDVAHEVSPLSNVSGEAILITSTAETTEPAPVSTLPTPPAKETTLPEQPSAPPPAPAANSETALPAQPEPKGVSRSELYGIAAASGVFSFILAVIFTLLFLALINGGLRFVKPSQLTQITNQINTIDAQSKELSGEIDALNNRLTAVESMDGRITSLEQNTQQLRKDADALGQRITDLSLQVDALVARTGRFQSFLDNLRTLLNNLNQQEVP